MKTREQILEAYENGKEFECVDWRDAARLMQYFGVEDWKRLGLNLRGDAKLADLPPPKELTRDNVLAELKGDVAFGFEKALGRRGISSQLMWYVVKMWLWVLDDPLQYHTAYTAYGLPLLRAVAVKYGFPNPIGEDAGSEAKYLNGDDGLTASRKTS